MLHRPRALVPSSPSTTSLALVELSAGPAWCFTARKPLFLRRRTPRHWPWSSLRRGWRGASPPASPCFFVAEHHVIGPGRAFGGAGVVLRRPLALVFSSRSTTPPIFSNRTIPGTRPGFPEFPSCARHGTSLTGESPVTGIYRQV